MLSRNHTLYHSSYSYFMFHYYCFACMDLDIFVLLFYFSLVLCCLTELFFLYRSLTLIFYLIGVLFFFYSNGKYFVMFVLRLMVCYYSFFCLWGSEYFLYCFCILWSYVSLVLSIRIVMFVIFPRFGPIKLVWHQWKWAVVYLC